MVIHEYKGVHAVLDNSHIRNLCEGYFTRVHRNVRFIRYLPYKVCDRIYATIFLNIFLKQVDKLDLIDHALFYLLYYGCILFLVLKGQENIDIVVAQKRFKLFLKY